MSDGWTGPFCSACLDRDKERKIVYERPFCLKCFQAAFQAKQNENSFKFRDSKECMRCSGHGDGQGAMTKETSCESCWSQHEWEEALPVEQVALLMLHFL